MEMGNDLSVLWNLSMEHIGLRGYGIEETLQLYDKPTCLVIRQRCLEN